MPLATLPTPDSASEAFQAVALLWAITLWTATVLVHALFARGAWLHAGVRKTTLVAPWTWALATLFGGPFVAAAYWLVHCSSLAAPSPAR